MADDDRALLPLQAHLDGLRTAVGTLTVAASRSWLGAPVPTCPGWTLLDLVAHVGMAQAWAEAALRGDHEAMGDVELVAQEGRASADPLRWLAERAERLGATLHSAGDDVDALVFLKQAPPPRQFWARRQCHEAVVHALDAVAARHRRLPTAADAWFGPDLAVDGIDELLVGFWQRGRSGPRSDPAARVLVRPTDADLAWLLEVGPQRTVTRRLRPGDRTALDAPGAAGGPGAPDAEVTGSAVDLYLALWNRGGEVDAPEGLLARWRDQTPISWA
ncbi:MAG TPA: maleylpyruvate isomerase N-terminal domain-containing protein [Dermatophilaceae bacterium]|nr:maleylpyruvate isomerase N-terminal domain-containing protein [Dermatophilaceae bacterium]